MTEIQSFQLAAQTYQLWNLKKRKFSCGFERARSLPVQRADFQSEKRQIHYFNNETQKKATVIHYLNNETTNLETFNLKSNSNYNKTSSNNDEQQW